MNLQNQQEPDETQIPAVQEEQPELQELDEAQLAAVCGGIDIDGEVTVSPGVTSGNQIQVPVHIPVNVSGSGNLLSVIGLLNPKNS